MAERRAAERPLAKTKIVATVGPACAERKQLLALARAGVDIFRLNFAHGAHEWLAGIVADIRSISDDVGQQLAILGDLSGPKIRLGELPGDSVTCEEGARFEFVRQPVPGDATKLTCTYERLIDDLNVDDRVLLADGTVSMCVVEKPSSGDRVVCEVRQPGVIRSRQGVNLPGVKLSTPSLTKKDRKDLAWAVENGLDYVGLSFVRRAKDVADLRAAIADHGTKFAPQIVAKIEKKEAIDDLDAILGETDAVMVARGDLGVEVDIARVPGLQKRIIRLCNEHRIPVITATQMLESMQWNERPTRAEASDVANAVIDGSDAVMLSGETAIGQYPLETVTMMSRIAHEAERLVHATPEVDRLSAERSRAHAITEAVTLGAGMAAEYLKADLIVVATNSGRTALAVSKQRNPVPILALTDRSDSARRMCLYWGVTPFESTAMNEHPAELISAVVEWGRRRKALKSGSKIVVVGKTNWNAPGHDLLLVHVVP